VYLRPSELSELDTGFAVFRDEDVSLQMKLEVRREGTAIEREYQGLPPNLIAGGGGILLVDRQ
jgi:hypothetical protein